MLAEIAKIFSNFNEYIFKYVGYLISAGAIEFISTKVGDRFLHNASVLLSWMIIWSTIANSYYLVYADFSKDYPNLKEYLLFMKIIGMLLNLAVMVFVFSGKLDRVFIEVANYPRK